MGQTLVRLSLILGLLGVFLLPVHAETMSISDLIEDAKSVNETTVILEGEAILEALERGDHAWININDGTGALGLWMDASLASKVTHYGNYDTRGDVIRVIGIFHRSCDEHGGDMDVHVSSLNVITQGHPLDHPVDVWRFTAAVILILSAIATLWFHRKLLLGWLDRSQPNVTE